MADEPKFPARPAPSSAGVATFLEQVKRTPSAQQRGSRGRLVFALDATMSRQATWDLAQGLQARMFDTAATLGGLDVQLVYFRGFAECRASRFVENGAGLSSLMSRIQVEGGHTQISKVLRHIRDETKRARVGAFIYVGDAMEENVDDLAALSGELGLLGVKGFVFHEGHDPAAGQAFREIARLTGGAYAAFDASAPGRLAGLLSAAAAYAAGGRMALEKQARDGGEAAQKLLSQMR